MCISPPQRTQGTLGINKTAVMVLRCNFSVSHIACGIVSVPVFLQVFKLKLRADEIKPVYLNREIAVGVG